MAVITALAAGRHCCQLTQPFVLSNGAVLESVQLVYETYGRLNAAKDNVVLVLHALSTHSHVASHAADPQHGWWEAMVGPGKPIDTDHFFVLCINNLGSCFGSTGPTSLCPGRGRPYQRDFPTLSAEDIVDAGQAVLQALGIGRLYALVGPSLAAMLALAWLKRYPKQAARAFLASGTDKAYGSNIAARVVQRDCITQDPAWQNGYYSKNPSAGFALARMMAHLSYRSAHELDTRFTPQSLPQHRHDFCCEQVDVAGYFRYNARKFVAKMDANSYLYMLDMMDRFNIHRGEVPVRAALAEVAAKVHVVGVDSDILYPIAQQRAVYTVLQQAGVSVQFTAHQSHYGHDAFLIETDAFGRYLRALLA